MGESCRFGAGRLLRLTLLSLALALSLVGVAGCGGGQDAAEGAASAPAAAEAASAALAGSSDAQAGEFDPAQVPSYTGSPYTVVADNVPDFSDVEVVYGCESYSPLDSLGRCGEAFAVVGVETMPTEERGSIGMVKPTGWHTVRYDDLIADKYLYNRCHLIGYQLTGENANEQNLITGTRYMNVDGMLPFENEVADYVESTGNHVLYRCTPIFAGDELVARGVHLQAQSVEDGGAGVSFNVFCYNVQPGIDIDYATGESWRAEQAAATETTAEVADASQDSKGAAASYASEEATYILNVNSGKFHVPGCSAVGKMKESNKREFTGTRDEAIASGFSPCGLCNP